MVLFISGKTRWKSLDFPGDFFRIKQSHLIIKHDYGSSTDKKNHSWRQPSKNPRFCYLNPALPISPAFHTASKATPCLVLSRLFFVLVVFLLKRRGSGGFKSLRICEGEFVSSPRGSEVLLWNITIRWRWCLSDFTFYFCLLKNGENATSICLREFAARSHAREIVFNF